MACVIVTAFDPGITEADFQAQIVETAEWAGWDLIYHTYDSRRSRKGFPDLVMVRKGRMILAEVKSASGTVSEAQARWFDGLLAVEHASGGTVAAHIWYPDDWDRIEATLTTRP